MNIIEKQQIVKDFHQLLETLLDQERDTLYATFEFALLLFSSKKMFDDDRFYSEKKSVRKKVIIWLKENFHNEKDYYFEQNGNSFYLVKKRSLHLFRAYREASNTLNRAEAERLYGVLMGFPKSATDAWFSDYDLNVGERVYLLNFYEELVFKEILGDIFLRGFACSRKHWQSEYRFQIREHVRIYELFPEIFLTDIQEDQEKVEYYNRVKSHLKKGNLLVKFSPLERFLFENIDFEWVQKRNSWRKKHRIISDFINMRHNTYKKMQSETAK